MLSLRRGPGRGAPSRWLMLMAAMLAISLASVAGAGATVLRGGPGPQTLTGTAAADSLFGGGGDDSLSGMAGRDRLVGGPGADTISGGPGRDRLLGRAGADRLLAKDGEADVVNCGTGEDIAVVDPVDRVSANCETVRGDAEETVAGPPAPPVGGAVSSIFPPSGPAEEVDGGSLEPIPPFEELPLAMFPAGHGWTGNGEGTFQDVGPPFVINNDRSFQITTDGAGDESIATSPELKPVDLTGDHVAFQSEVGFSARLKTVKLRLSSGDINDDYAEATVWREDNDPVVLDSSFETQSIPIGAFHVVGNVDWSKIDRAQIILTDEGAGPVILYVAGIYAVPTYKTATVSFSFDDGLESDFQLGRKKLSAFHYPASAYVIADAVGTPGFLSLGQLDTLRDKNGWEIGGHAAKITDHNAPNGLDSLGPAELNADMDELRDWLDENGFSRRTFAYPKGAAGEAVRHYAARDYCAARVTAAGPETIPPRDKYTIRGWSINGLETDANDVEAQIDQAIAEKSWLVLTFHKLVTGAPVESTDFNYNEFARIVNYVHVKQVQRELQVRTIADAVGC
jgi:RTX calcium-binding nonapeptide repeat (4 copies)